MITSKSALKVWVNEKGRTLVTQFVDDDPLKKTRVSRIEELSPHQFSRFYPFLSHLSPAEQTLRR